MNIFLMAIIQLWKIFYFVKMNKIYGYHVNLIILSVYKNIFKINPLTCVSILNINIIPIIVNLTITLINILI
jgi:hypothetical protein